MNPIFLAPTVCNAGPLIGLARINLEGLPFQLFPEVIAPEEVHKELLIKDSPDHESLATALEQATFYPRQLQPDRMLLAELDAGETAVIMAALQLSISSVILDEKKASRIAANVYGLRVKGTEGSLVEAKKRGLIGIERRSSGRVG
jgi:predicted nucleic acid-binding protein